MATIIAREDGRYEIRESHATSRGPRSRTLAIFRELTAEVLQRAEARASRPIDRNNLLTRAAELGLHLKRIAGTDEASLVIERLREGLLWPTHVRAVHDAVEELETQRLPDHLAAMLDWLGADDERRGRTLVDLLGLADAIVRHQPDSPRTRQPLKFPRLADCPDGRS